MALNRQSNHMLDTAITLLRAQVARMAVGLDKGGLINPLGLMDRRADLRLDHRLDPLERLDRLEVHRVDQEDRLVDQEDRLVDLEDQEDRLVDLEVRLVGTMGITLHPIWPVYWVIFEEHSFASPRITNRL
jgi:hypothetical protein